ncbi:MAG: hypothetical protein RLZZ496_1447 [Pseudomonadota bacterium]|jgi:hypothetical protein|nr:DUF1674 domain-containing protein [Alphaproteobacteria bacterium]
MAEPDPRSDEVEPTKTLTPEAQRALAEAAERRQIVQDQVRPQEVHGRSGPEPVRYGDWENKGIASDF